MHKLRNHAVLSADGDVDHWQSQGLIFKPDSAAAIVDLLSRHISNGSRHIRRPVTLVPSKAQNGRNEIGWKFTDEQGRDWNGDAIVEPSDKAGKFVLTVKLARQSI